MYCGYFCLVLCAIEVGLFLFMPNPVVHWLSGAAALYLAFCAGQCFGIIWRERLLKTER